MAEMLSTIYGPLSVPDWDNDLIVRTLRQHGEWAFCEPTLLAPLVRAGDSIWDVGAFLGTFGLGLTQLCTETPHELIAFEPSAALHEHIRANLARNAPCSSRLVPLAVAGKSGRLRPEATEARNAGAVAYVPASDDGESHEGDVISRSISELRAEHGAYNVLKLDVEGMENEVIRSDFEHILEHRPVIWAECNESLTSIALLEALRSAQYEPMYVAFPAFRKANFLGSSNVIYPMAYEAVLLAAPPDRMESFRCMVQGEDIITVPVRTSFDLRQALWATPRWSMPEWTEMSRPELIALLGRQMRNEKLRTFLNNATVDSV